MIVSCDQLGETLRAAPTQVWVGHSSQVFTLFEGLAVQKDTLFKWNCIPCLRLKTLKTIPCSATPTRTGQIRECPSGVTSNRGKKKTVKRQADTKTRRNTSQVSLFYQAPDFIHFISFIQCHLIIIIKFHLLVEVGYHESPAFPIFRSSYTSIIGVS